MARWFARSWAADPMAMEPEALRRHRAALRALGSMAYRRRMLFGAALRRRMARMWAAGFAAAGALPALASAAAARGGPASGQALALAAVQLGIGAALAGLLVAGYALCQGAAKACEARRLRVERAASRRSARDRALAEARELGRSCPERPGARPAGARRL